MGHNSSVAASLKPEQRKQLFVEIQSSAKTVTAISKREGVSRKFLYQQKKKGNQALDKEFEQQKENSDILYWLPDLSRYLLD